MRKYGPAYIRQRGAKAGLAERRVLAELTACRTPALGSHTFRCDLCGHLDEAYNSCCNRHCPLCGGPARARWLDRMLRDALPVPYFHLVFTLPHTLSRLILANRRAIYTLLFRSAWAALRELAADPKHLGARVGAVMVLHTWGQNLQHHPHVHAVVPGGGLSEDGQAERSAVRAAVDAACVAAGFCAGAVLRLAGQRGPRGAADPLPGTVGGQRGPRAAAFVHRARAGGGASAGLPALPSRPPAADFS